MKQNIRALTKLLPMRTECSRMMPNKYAGNLSASNQQASLIKHNEDGYFIQNDYWLSMHYIFPMRIFIRWGGGILFQFQCYWPLALSKVHQWPCTNQLINASRPIPAKSLHNHDIVSVHFKHFYYTEICDKLRRDLGMFIYKYLNVNECWLTSLNFNSYLLI